MRLSQRAILVLTIGVFVALVALHAVTLPARNKAELTLVSAHETIREFDPLFLKVALHNHTPDHLLLDRSFEYVYGGFDLAIRHEDTGVYVADDGMRGFICAVQLTKYDLRPAARIVSYEVLFRGKGQPMFSRPGTYEVKASLNISGKVLSSKPLRIRVHSIPEEERRTLQEDPVVRIGPHHTTNVAYRALGVATPINSGLMRKERTDDEELTHLQNVERRLGDSVAKQTLRWKLAIDAIGRAKNAEERQKAREAFEELRKCMDRVTREVADLTLIQEYKAIRDWEEAAKLLPRIVERSHAGDAIKHEVEQGWRWEQSVRAFFPEDRRLSCQTRTLHLFGEALLPHALVGSGIGNLTGGTTGWRGPVIGIHLLSASPVTRMRSLSIHETTGEVIDELSRQSGVPLSAPLNVREQPNLANQADLRNWMVLFAWRHKGVWVRSGDGYDLTIPANGDKPDVGTIP